MSQVTQTQVATAGPKDPSAFTVELNAILMAMLTGHKGATRPATIYPGMMWIDDSADPVWILQFYDGTNDVAIISINSTTHTLAALSLANGGTGASDAPGAVTNLGLATAAKTDEANSFTKPQRIDATETVASLSGSKAPDVATYGKFDWTTSGDLTNLANPTLVASDVGREFRIKIDNAGAHALSAAGTYWKRINGTGLPTLPTGDCYLFCEVVSTSKIVYHFAESE